MNMKIVCLTVGLYAVACGVLFGTWIAIVFNKEKLNGADTLISFCHVSLGILVGHIITVLNSWLSTQSARRMPVASQAASTSQAGFANPFLLLALAVGIAATLCLSGCASVTQAASAYNTSGMIAARAAEDLNIKLWTENACGTPLSTIVRHPEIAGGLKSLCLSASTASANDLLSQLPGPGAVPTTTPVPTAGISLPGVLAPPASVPK